LTDLSVDVAKELVQRKGKWLYLDGLTASNREIASEFGLLR